MPFLGFIPIPEFMESWAADQQPAFHRDTNNDMTLPLMKCGHVAQGLCNGEPVCMNCDTPDTLIIADTLPDLSGRKAKCGECSNVRPSSVKLPLFEYNKNSEQDSFYCGCRGWN